jgi:Transposase IS4
VVHCLITINVGVLGTTRKNAEGIPRPLLLAKDAKRSLVWNSIIAIQVGWALTFVWQDNNAVLGITTAFTVKERVERLRRRPKISSTNAKIVRPVFGEFPNKRLFIPRAIDVYNHGMNSIDTANQFRKGFTCHRPRNRKWWRPIFYWLLDTCKTNAFLIWKSFETDSSHRLHEKFYDTLIDELLIMGLELEVAPEGPLRPEHTEIHLDKPTYCVWGLKNPGSCVAGIGNKRKFGDVIVNDVRPNARPAQVKTGCKECGKALCTAKSCWDNWHAQKWL